MSSASSGGDPTVDLQAGVAELGKIVLGERSLTDVMDTVARIARETLPGTDEVSVTLVKDDEPHTAAFTGRTAIELDERQYESGYGPCLDAAATGRTITIDDTTTTGPRYTDFARAAAAAGVRSTGSIGLPVPQGTVGALNLYSTRVAAFDDEVLAAAQTFAGAAAVALANAALYDDATQLARQMQQAMQSRAVIEQAKGILMRDNRCSADEAFTMLVEASNRSNRKLRAIADSIVRATERGA